MIKRSTAVKCVTALIVPLVIWGCSSADTPDPNTGTGGTTGAGATTGSGATAGTTSTTTGAGGTSATGGTPGTGGTTGGTSATGGTPGTGGATGGTGAGGDTSAGGTTGGASTTGGTGGTGIVDPACKGIKTGMACTPEGTNCPTLTCGLADSGSRSCNCATTWSCTSCDFTNSPFKDKPADITTCTGTEADKIPCTTLHAVCEGAAGGEVCACYTDDEGAMIWDCDKAPTTWAVAAQ
jgi:hypothetical protein